MIWARAPRWGLRQMRAPLSGRDAAWVTHPERAPPEPSPATRGGIHKWSTRGASRGVEPTLRTEYRHEHDHHQRRHGNLLQGLGRGPRRHVLARLAAELGRMGRPDALPGAERLPRGRA